MCHTDIKIEAMELTILALLIFQKCTFKTILHFSTSSSGTLMWDGLQQCSRMWWERRHWRKNKTASLIVWEKVPPRLHVRNTAWERKTQDLQIWQKEMLCNYPTKAQLPQGTFPSYPCKYFLSTTVCFHDPLHIVIHSLSLPYPPHSTQLVNWVFKTLTQKVMSFSLLHVPRQAARFYPLACPLSLKLQ